ncbi:MAG: hypothetical protein WB607_11325 [Candidatus Acidiferrum sp.]|jgi:hypothetical protein
MALWQPLRYGTDRRDAQRYINLHAGTVWGGDYGAYFISRFTTGDEARGTPTFYFTMSTWTIP